MLCFLSFHRRKNTLGQLHFVKDDFNAFNILPVVATLKNCRDANKAGLGYTQVEIPAVWWCTAAAEEPGEPTAGPAGRSEHPGQPPQTHQLKRTRGLNDWVGYAHI